MKKFTSKSSSPRVALIIESSRSYGRDLLMGIAKYVRIHGPWSVEFQEGDPGESIPPWFDRWKWDGVIARVTSMEISDSLLASKAPVVDLSGILPESGFPRIRSDETLVGRMAADHLLERGFKRFAFCGFEGMDWSDSRREGFKQRVAEAGHSCEVFAIPQQGSAKSASNYEEHGERQEKDMKRWLASLVKPCGLMACNDARGRQLLNCCRDLGIAVPDELAVIGVDKDEIFCELSDLPLSSVILNAQQIGFEAAAMLARMMAGEKNPPKVNVIKPVGVLARQSTDVLAIEDRHVAEALRCIREHACNGLDVESLLKVVPLSRSVLERRFTQSLGSSPKAEILRVRIERVCRLLTESELTLAEIAYKAGFEHPEYMSRLFKNRMGITPGEFRKQTGISGM